MDEFEDLLRVIAVLFLLYIGGGIFRYFQCPALIGEILIGLLVGPYANPSPLDDLLPSSYYTVVSTVGKLGLCLLVLEGGLHIDIHTLKELAPKATCIALSGTGLPVLFSYLLMPRFNAFSNEEGLVMGTSLSSTAIGMATVFMKDFGLLDTRVGKLICCAAMIDDVASLILLGMISAGNESESVPWGPKEGVLSTLIPLFTSVGFILVCLVLVVYMPKILDRMLKKDLKVEVIEQISLFVMLVMSTGLMAGAHYLRTTYLLGPFMTGVAFSTIIPARDAFDKHVSQVGGWLSSIFFLSVGVTIRLNVLFNGESIGYGAVLSLIAVGSKVVTGVFDWKNKLVIGWAMVGRGELGFVMAEEASRKDLTSELAFSVTAWALLVATLLSPVVLRFILRNKEVEEEVAEPNET